MERKQYRFECRRKNVVEYLKKFWIVCEIVRSEKQMWDVNVINTHFITNTLPSGPNGKLFNLKTKINYLIFDLKHILIFLESIYLDKFGRFTLLGVREYPICFNFTRKKIPVIFKQIAVILLCYTTDSTADQEIYVVFNKNSSINFTNTTRK